MTQEENPNDFRTQLKNAIIGDVEDRKEWYDRVSKLEKRRLGERKKRKTQPYAGAPNFVIPLIDDMVRARTSQEISMLLNAKNISFFLPMSTGATQFVQQVEGAFTWYLRIMLKVRSKLEVILDKKNNIGMGLAKLIESDEIMPEANRRLPDFEEVSPFDLIVPYETKINRMPERMVHVIRLTERELRERAISKKWKNIDEIIKRARQNQQEPKDDQEKYRERDDTVGVVTNPSTLDYYVIWEIYHWRRKGTDNKLFDNKPEDVSQKKYGGAEKWVTIMAPDAHDVEIMDYRYGEEKFPFIQFRYENRVDKWYDTRGIAQLLVDEQIYATQSKNMKATFLEYAGKPLFSGKQTNSGNISFTPGSILPEGMTAVQPPRIPSQFDYDINQSYAWSEKRVGASQQSLSTQDPKRGKGGVKTATEVNAAQNIAQQFSSDAIERFNDPLQNLFQMIWEKLRVKQILFPYVVNDQPGVVAAEFYRERFMLVPAGNSNTANPMFAYQQLMTILPYVMQSPLAKHYEILAHLVSFVDPKLVNQFLYNPNQTQGQLPPIVQQVQGMAQQLQQLQQVIQELGGSMQKLGPDLETMKEDTDLNKNQSQSNTKAIKDIAQVIGRIANNGNPEMVQRQIQI